jgi:hypothetical protein
MITAKTAARISAIFAAVAGTYLVWVLAVVACAAP